MRIGIIGAGNVGGGLGTALADVGHTIVFGVRDPDSAKTKAAVASARGARATSPEEAVRDADVVVFTLRWDAVPAIAARLPSMNGRIVIDAMNRLAGDSPRSTTDDLADLLPGARLAKAFNTIGFENLTTARNRSQAAAMFVAGDDQDAKRTAMDLAREIGFEPCDAGDLANTKSLEEMVRVWLALSRTFGRTVAYAISRG